jgi:ubiquitin-like modifier-activating enzyme ATG7
MFKFRAELQSYRPRAPSDAPIDSNQPAPSPSAESSPLGLVPHQIRGFLAQFKNMILTGQAYNKCTGCSEHVSHCQLDMTRLKLVKVLKAYREEGFEFLKKACQDASYLEQVTGLDKLAAEMEHAMESVDWAEGSEGGDDF